MIARDTKEYYLAFISLVFGIFITVWAQPLVDLFRDSDRHIVIESGTNTITNLVQSSDGHAVVLSVSPTNSTAVITAHITNRGTYGGIVKTFGRLGYLAGGQGVFTLGVIVCLWWWYGIFLRNIDPAKGFLMYVVDFVSLASFAVAAGIWRDVSGCFAATVLFACVCIFARFAFAYRKTRGTPFARRALFWAMVVVCVCIATVLLGLVFCLGSYWANPDKTIIDEKILGTVLMGVMLISVAVTVEGVRLTEGLGWGRAFAYDEVNSEKLIDPFLSPVEEWSATDMAVTENRCRLAIKEFERRCTEFGLSRTGSLRASQVHSTHDLWCQAKLAVYAADEKHDNVLKRVQVMCFVHWFDDLMDQSKKRTKDLCGQEKIELKDIYSSWGDPVEKFINEYRHWFTDQSAQVCFDTGLKRLIYGSRLFREIPASEKAELRIKHKNVLAELAPGPARSDFETLIAEVAALDEQFIDFTVKTVMEFWFGMEMPHQRAEYMFLYSLLYGPSLYYHDCNEEKTVGELSEHSSPLPEEVTASMIRLVGKRIEAQIVNDPRKRARAEEVAHFVVCFGEVLPQKVRVAYEEVAATLRQATR